jgi:F-type H+-transporting ATPase subunit gamma
MANVKELRGRIRSVGNIRQITRAMEMVASMKLRKVQAKALAHRIYTEELVELGRRVAAGQYGELDRPLLTAREIRTVGVFIVTSDRGLCGSYNTNIGLFARRFLQQQVAEGRRIRFYVYGRKGYTFLQRRGADVARYFSDPPLDQLGFKGAREVADALYADFMSGVVDSVRVFYTAFLSPGRFEPRDLQFLPFARAEIFAGEKSTPTDYLIEPSAAALAPILRRKYLETVIYDAMLESLASEHASRRIAMKGATDAASAMQKELKKRYNRARQESITKELLDIVGGANAVS